MEFSVVRFFIFFYNRQIWTCPTCIFCIIVGTFLLVWPEIATSGWKKGDYVCFLMSSGERGKNETQGFFFPQHFQYVELSICKASTPVARRLTNNERQQNVSQ